MRILCFMVIGALGSVEHWEELFLDDTPSSFWYEAVEDLDDTSDDSVRLPHGVGDEPSLRAGMLWEVPYTCRRPVSILAGPEYASALRDVIASGFMPSLNVMFKSRGSLMIKDPRYKSLHNSVRKFREGLEVSSAALHAMLELKKENEIVTAKIFWKKYRTVIRPSDPLHRSRCDLIIWYKFVIDDATGAEVKDLEVEEYISTGGHLVYRPVGSALKRILEFELNRIKT